MYFSGYRDGFVEEGSMGQKNGSVAMKVQKHLASLGELEPLCSVQTMGNENIILVPKDFSCQWKWQKEK